MQAREFPFKELLSHIVDNRGRTCPVTDSGRPLIATNCISNERLYPSYDTERFVSEETYRDWFRAHPLPGDIIFVCKGSPGRVALAPDPVDFCIAQDMVAVRADATKVYPRYLFAALRSRTVQDRIGNMHVGTLIPHFKKGDFDKLDIPVPDRDVQEFIGDTYFELSAKIEQNRRTAAKLEALARATFRVWFIDFAPVRGKAAGATTYPGLPPGAFAALPSTFTDSKAGPIPQGWEVRPLDSVATFLNGLALQKYPPRGDGTDLPVIKIAQLRKGSTEGADLANDSIDYEYKVKDRDLLFSWSGTLEAVFWFGGPGALNQHLFKVTSDHFPAWLVFEWIHQHLDEFRLIASSKATTMGHIKRSHLKEAVVAVPPAAWLQLADAALTPLYDMHANLSVESRKLADLRDYLLPRLLSGEVRVEVTP